MRVSAVAAWQAQLRVALRLENGAVETLIVFHSVLGLRPVEEDAAQRFRSAGFEVALPDLYGGHRTESMEEGFRLMRQIGWPVICKRAREATANVPATSLLVGFSMGAGVIASLWPNRPRARAVLLFHALAKIPNNVRPGLKIQLHIADADEFVSPEQTTVWTAAAMSAGARIESFTYPDCGHFFTDPKSAGYSAIASEMAWDRALSFLAQL